jgi:hypothetical protein
MAWSRGRIYGVQRSHLFYADAATSQIVDKGSFNFAGARYLPTAISSDDAGNLLGIAGGRLFRYVPEEDAVLISAVEFEGWLVKGPGGRIHAFYPDGRLFVWDPANASLRLLAQYPRIVPRIGEQHKDEPYGSIEIGVLGTGEILVARSGFDDPDQSVVLVYAPGASQPRNLGNPVPQSLFLTAITIGSGDVAYGLSAETVYGLGRTPARLYSVTRA